MWESVQSRVLIQRRDINHSVWALPMSGCTLMCSCVESCDESHSPICRAGFVWFASMLSSRRAFSLFCHCVKLHAWNDLVMIFQRAPSTELRIFFLYSSCSNSLSPVSRSIKEMTKPPHVSEYRLTFPWDTVVTSLAPSRILLSPYIVYTSFRVLFPAPGANLATLTLSQSISASLHLHLMSGFFNVDF